MTSFLVLVTKQWHGRYGTMIDRVCLITQKSGGVSELSYQWSPLPGMFFPQICMAVSFLLRSWLKCHFLKPALTPNLKSFPCHSVLVRI